MKLKVLSGLVLAAMVVAIFFPQKTNAQFANFITAKNGKLYDGDQELRWCSVNIPFVDYTEDGEGGTWKELTPWEQEDLVKTVVQMGGKVIRRYALSTRQPNKFYEAHVQGPNQFSEKAFRAFDRFLALCNKYGIRVIVPFVDQYDYNWVGGIKSYEAFRGVALDDGQNFVTNLQIRNDFKATINYVLNRVNSVTGVKYKDDKAILAWETGNELWCENKNYSWVADIAAYVKSIDSNHLLIDGDMEPTIAGRPGMTNTNIDIVSNHYYKWSNNHPDLDSALKIDMAIARGKKPFIVGEYGLTNPDDIHALLDSAVSEGVAGIMLWSLRGHREAGGFWQHREGTYPNDGIDYWAYHWPGFAINDNYRETQVMQDIYQHAYLINGQTAPVIPVPEAPELLPITNPALAINWKGSVGANLYDVQRSNDSINWVTIGANVTDMYKNTAYPPVFKDNAVADSGYYYRVIAKNSSGSSVPSNVIVWGNPSIRLTLSENVSDTLEAFLPLGYTRQMTGVDTSSNTEIIDALWSSSKPGIVTLSDLGVVKGIGTGSDTVTVVTKDGKKKAVCIVHVITIRVTSIDIKPEEAIVHINGAKLSLSAVIEPKKASNKLVNWSSSNISLAEVSDNGEVTAISEGNVSIIVTSADGILRDTCRVIVTQPLPDGWNTNDIGDVAAKGGAGYSGNSFILQGSGYDIEENYDEFRFAYVQRSGNFSISARVDTLSNPHYSAKAGVMIREDLSNNARMAFVPLTHFGTFFQRRVGKGGVSQETTVKYDIRAPYWVKVVRINNTMQGLISPDGTNWTQLGQVPLSMSNNVYAGLAVTSHNDGKLCTAKFSNVLISDTTAVGIKEKLVEKNISLYPNPAFNEDVCIDFRSDYNKKTIIITDSRGTELFRVITSLNKYILNKDFLKSGYYLVNIIGKNYKETRGLVIK